MIEQLSRTATSGASAAATPPHTHIPALDGLRGLAILLVLYAHFTLAEPTNALGIVERFYFRTAQLSWWGVDLFFVLSGFLITGILFDAKQKSHFFRNFYMRRVLRIFPLYYGLLVIAFWIVPLLVSPNPVGSTPGTVSSLWLWFYASNIGMSYYNSVLHFHDLFEFDHFWSLAVEEHFYFVWPFLVYAFRRKSLLWICGGIIAGALGLRLLLVGLDVHFMKRFVLTPCRMDALAMGALMALLIRGDWEQARLLKAARAVALFGGLILLGTILSNAYPEALQHGKTWTPYFLQPAQPPGSDAMSWFLHAGLLSVLAPVFGASLLLVISARRDSLTERFWTLSWLRFFGKYSYGIYVFHFALIRYLRPWADAALARVSRLETHLPPLPAAVISAPLFHSLLYFCLMTGLSVAVAWLSWHLYEKHFLKLKDRFV
ncbi:MAG TPA: acyltransferase [Blastocatellia bacterium]|nr:acyltransferase [Blastocatellia bacterium]